MKMKKVLSNKQIKESNFKKCIGLILKVHRKHPDFRLGQLLINVITPEQDLYYTIDEDFIKYFEHFLKKY